MVHLYVIKVLKFKEETKSRQLTLELFIDSNEGFLFVSPSLSPPASSSPFIRGQIGIDLCQTARKQSNHIKEIKWVKC